jgi:hypothetical protein
MGNLPDFVFEYLITKNYIGKTKTLIIGENYPGKNFEKSYFYRSLPGCSSFPIGGNTPSFFTQLCDQLLIPKLDYNEQKLSELERLIKFLEHGFLLIDAQKNLHPPIKPAKISSKEIDNLMTFILIINPKNILFLTENNQNIINQLSNHHLYHKIKERIIYNFLKKRQWFSFPSAPANPNHFKTEIETVRKYYFL